MAIILSSVSIPVCGSGTLKKKPQLFIEMHGATNDLEKNNIAQNVTKTLVKYEYSIFHVEKKIYINENNFRDAKEGHLFCIWFYSVELNRDYKFDYKNYVKSICPNA